MQSLLTLTNSQNDRIFPAVVGLPSAREIRTAQHREFPESQQVESTTIVGLFNLTDLFSQYIRASILASQHRFSRHPAYYSRFALFRTDFL
jgi:hypothetical protein